MNLTDKGNTLTRNVFNITVIVAALGYFVDIYDLILFSIVRVPSLKAIGIAKDDIQNVGIHLLNVQMIGMLIGGIVWGILGDKKGRMTALFLTILIYSLANIANGFAQTLEQYTVLRFIAGFGLAGELGLGITLVSEVMSKEARGWGTTVVAGVGIVGAVLAFLVASWGWRQAYWLGGALGLLLLGLRIYIHESGMFKEIKEMTIKRGHFLSIFTNSKHFGKFLRCIGIGLPVWFVIGILVTFSNDFGVYMKVNGDIIPGKAVMFHYIGASIGSFGTGMLSQLLHSRKKSLTIAITAVLIFSAVFFCCFHVSANVIYFVLFILGIAQGYWAVFVTSASEQFGTNLRSTITTTVPNFVRGATVLMTLWWKAMSNSMGIWQSAIIIGAVVLSIALYSTLTSEETYGKDLNYVE